MPKTAGLTLSEITAKLGGEGVGNANTLVFGLASLARATVRDIGFIAHARYRQTLEETQAGIVVLTPAWLPLRKGPAIVSDDPYLYYARLSQWFEQLAQQPSATGYVHPSAVVETALPDSVSVGALSYVGAGCRVGQGTIIGTGCHLAPGVVVGNNCLLHAGVTIYANSHLGQRVIVHSGVVLGSDGFGYAPNKSKAGVNWVKIVQQGGVRVGDDVEIGANTTVDRGALDNTIIGDGVKLDNQIQVGHNASIGAHTAIAGATVMAGGVKIGSFCMIGGASAINGYVTIPAGTILSGGSNVESSLETAGRYTSIFPVLPHGAWGRVITLLRQLPHLAQRIKKLEQKND